MLINPSILRFMLSVLTVVPIVLSTYEIMVLFKRMWRKLIFMLLVSAAAVSGSMANESGLSGRTKSKLFMPRSSV